MSAVFLPVFHHFENGNVFTGSCGLFRYKITPDAVMIPPKKKEVDYEASSIKAEYWHGPLSYEFSDLSGWGGGTEGVHPRDLQDADEPDPELPSRGGQDDR